MSGHLGEIFRLKGASVNERNPGNQQAAAFQHGELSCRGCVVMTALAEMNEKSIELMVGQPLANRGEVRVRHLQGEYVVGDMPLVFAVEIMRQPLAAGVRQAADH